MVVVGAVHRVRLFERRLLCEWLDAGECRKHLPGPLQPRGWVSAQDFDPSKVQCLRWNSVPGAP